MNKRIKQLAEQAHVTVLTTKGMENIVDGCYIISPDKLDKFAELIVAECLDVVAMRIYLGNNEMCRQECKALAADIKEHFGVEQ